mmetsp:Transcript_56380/g.157096  ORF Transcript_56380/g.157096 Transcript_56380/m.157096 type:complete len:255 (-) Transcript_56380:791-1555(-)
MRPSADPKPYHFRSFQSSRASESTDDTSRSFVAFARGRLSWASTLPGPWMASMSIASCSGPMLHLVNASCKSIMANIKSPMLAAARGAASVAPSVNVSDAPSISFMTGAQADTKRGMFSATHLWRSTSTTVSGTTTAAGAAVAIGTAARNSGGGAVDNGAVAIPACIVDARATMADAAGVAPPRNWEEAPPGVKMAGTLSVTSLSEKPGPKKLEQRPSVSSSTASGETFGKPSFERFDSSTLRHAVPMSSPKVR